MLAWPHMIGEAVDRRQTRLGQLLTFSRRAPERKERVNLRDPVDQRLSAPGPRDRVADRSPNRCWRRAAGMSCRRW
ncbi:MAG: hypothetical protein HY319_30145 [Armatimonadetes bacterium]|nr:hypothetical protein [Armatimonadota bacterium]